MIGCRVLNTITDKERQDADDSLCVGIPTGGDDHLLRLGTFTEYPVSGPVGISAGPDGSLWYTEGFVSSAHVGRITPAGVVTLFSIPSGNATVLSILLRVRTRLHVFPHLAFRLHGIMRSQARIPQLTPASSTTAMWLDMERRHL